MKLLEKLSYLGVVLPNLSSVWNGEDLHDVIAPSPTGLRVSMYRSWPASGQVLTEWANLARTLPMGSVFTSPAWQGAVARPFLRVGRYRLITVQQGTAVRAVLPLQVGAGGVLETPAEMISDYLEPLVSPEFESESWQLIVGMLRSQCAQSRVPVVLHNLPADGRCRAVLSEMSHHAGFTLTDEESIPAARMALPKTWDGYLKTLDGRERKELKRKIKNAVTQVGARLEIVGDGPRLHDELHRALGFIEQAGGSKGIKAKWTYRPIFKRAAKEISSSGQLKIYLLMMNDQPAASLICFPSPAGPLMWAGGFDPAMFKHSPGIVLFGMAIQHSIEAGAQYFDLLRGQHRYKGELGTTDYPLRKLTLKFEK